MSKIRVLCVDDHRIVREGIASLLNRQPDIEVVASAATVQEAIECFAANEPDVTLMDLQLGAESGLTAIRAIRGRVPSARVIVLSMFQGEEDIFGALEAGASAYVLKDTLSGLLIRMVRDIHAGSTPEVSPEVQARLDQRAERPTLTQREKQVIELISRGMRNKEIGATLGISEETAQVHVKHILAKFHVQDRTAALTEAVRRGIIHIT